MTKRRFEMDTVIARRVSCSVTEPRKVHSAGMVTICPDTGQRRTIVAM